MHYHPTEENPYAWDFEQNMTVLQYDEDKLGTTLSHINTYVGFVLAIVANAVLFYLILKRTPPHMKQYKVMLMPGVVINIIYSVVHVLSFFKINTNDGVALIAMEGMANRWPLEVRICVLSFFGFLTLLITAISPAQTYYRYYCITRPNPMTIKQTICLFGFAIVLTLPVFFFAHESYSNSAQSRPGYNYANLWYKQVPVPKLLIADDRSFYQQMNCNLSGAIVLSSYLVFATFAAKTVRILKTKGYNLPEKTKALQRQLTYYLLLQAFLPCIIEIFPMIYLVAKLVLHDNAVNPSIMINVCIVLIPVCNPLMTIIVMAPYRKCLLAMFKKKRVKFWSNSSLPTIT